MNWKQHVLLIILVIASAVAQTTLTVLLWGGVQPDLLLVVVALLGLFLSPSTGSLYAFGMGYLHDLLTGSSGIFMFERVLIYILANRLSGQFYAKTVGAQFVVIALLSIVDTLLLAILSAIFGQSVLRGTLIWHMPIRAIATAIAGVPLYFLTRWICERAGGGTPKKALT